MNNLSGSGSSFVNNKIPKLQKLKKNSSDSGNESEGNDSDATFFEPSCSRAEEPMDFSTETFILNSNLDEKMISDIMADDVNIRTESMDVCEYKINDAMINTQQDPVIPELSINCLSAKSEEKLDDSYLHNNVETEELFDMPVDYILNPDIPSTSRRRYGFNPFSVFRSNDSSDEDDDYSFKPISIFASSSDHRVESTVDLLSKFITDELDDSWQWLQTETSAGDNGNPHVKYARIFFAMEIKSQVEFIKTALVIYNLWINGDFERLEKIQVQALIDQFTCGIIHLRNKFNDWKTIMPEQLFKKYYSAAQNTYDKCFIMLMRLKGLYSDKMNTCDLKHQQEIERLQQIMINDNSSDNIDYPSLTSPVFIDCSEPNENDCLLIDKEITSEQNCVNISLNLKESDDPSLSLVKLNSPECDISRSDVPSFQHHLELKFGDFCEQKDWSSDTSGVSHPFKKVKLGDEIYPIENQSSVDVKNKDYATSHGNDANKKQKFKRIVSMDKKLESIKEEMENEDVTDSDISVSAGNDLSLNEPVVNNDESLDLSIIESRVIIPNQDENIEKYITMLTSEIFEGLLESDGSD